MLFLFVALLPLTTGAAVPAPSTEPATVITPSAVTQGGSLVLLVTPAKPCRLVAARLLGHDIPCYPLGSGWRGIAGLDAQAPVGRQELAIRVEYSDGSRRDYGRAVTVKKGAFRSERIKLPPEQLKPSILLKLKEEGVVVGAALAGESGEQLWAGGFAWPVRGRITSPFGGYRVYVGSRTGGHRGVDIGGNPTGTPVAAPNAGRVVLARLFETMGNTVVIDHGQGLHTVYMHMSMSLVKEGDSVVKGTPIGKVGSLGLSTGPHLHWGMTVHDVRVDPLEWVKRLVAG